MKLFIFIISVFYVFTIYAEADLCLSQNLKSDFCHEDQLRVNAQVLIDQYILEAKTNRPKESLKTKEKIQEIFTKIVSCNPRVKCSDLSLRIRNNLGRNWIETQSLESWTVRNKNDENVCHVAGELWIKNGNTTIRGNILHSTGLLSYEIPSVSCDNGVIPVKRKIRISENGVLLWDHSEDVDHFPGKLLFPKTKRTPKLEINELGNAVIRTSDNATFEIDSSTGKLINSNFLDPIMFNSDHCKTKYKKVGRKKRSYTEVIYKERAKPKFSSRSMLLFGSSSESRKVQRVMSKIPRKSF